MDLSSCICCWTGINALLYLASAIVQWVLIGKKSADGVACVHGVALAGAILSSLATLFSFILAFCSCCCQQGTTKARRCNWLLQYLQLSLKLGALTGFYLGFLFWGGKALVRGVRWDCSVATVRYGGLGACPPGKF